MGTSTAGNGNIRLKHALSSMFAGFYLGLTGCSDVSTVNVDTEIKSDYPQTFASLSESIQGEIRAAYEKCLGDVKVFASEETDLKLRQLELNDGQNDCDHQRSSRIRSAKAQQDMEDTTRKITSPD